MALNFKERQFSEERDQRQTDLNCSGCCLTASNSGPCGCAGKEVLLEKNTFIYQNDQAKHSILLFKPPKRTFLVVFSHNEVKERMMALTKE